MTRKNMLADLIAATAHEATHEDETEKLAMANSSEPAKTEERVLAGPVRTMGLALDRMENETKALHDALASGEKVVELDPALIEISFIRDRLDFELTLDDDFVRSIEENGQEVPILVRQHPDKTDRFQVAYGHRRLAAIKLLNRKVRAVVRPLTDAELVVAQGVENTARKDLSYIEKALFALGLENKGFTRDIIIQALSTDKGELSKLISVAKRIPDDLIRLIGAAPGAGRRRWLELADKLEDDELIAVANKAASTNDFIQMNSDDRFVAILKSVTAKPVKQATEASPVKSWRSQDSSVTMTMNQKAKKVAIELSNEKAKPFSDWLSSRLDSLYEEFKQTETNDGD